MTSAFCEKAVSCAWHQIVDRLEELGKIDNCLKLNEVKKTGPQPVPAAQAC